LSPRDADDTENCQKPNRNPDFVFHFTFAPKDNLDPKEAFAPVVLTANPVPVSAEVCGLAPSPPL
jgi:hypothetical protein